MEFINKIELRGIIGTAAINTVGDTHVCRCSLVTEYSYKGKDGSPVIDSTWFNIAAWEGRGMPDFNRISKGAIVQVSGRVRTYKYTLTDGSERNSWEIFARKVTLLEPDDDPMQPQRFL